MLTFVDLAKSQKGEKEVGVNNIKYNTWYYRREVNGHQYPWCATFISWCGQFSDLHRVIPVTSSVKRLYRTFSERGKISKNPTLGCIVINSEKTHAGILVELLDSSFKTIEGNVDGEVVEKEYFSTDGLMFIELYSNESTFSETTTDGTYSDLTSGSQQSSLGASTSTTLQIPTRVYHPTIEVDFHTETGLLAAVSSGITSAEVSNDVISVSTTRLLPQDCPTFSVSLVWREDWFRKVASNDLVVIRLQRPPEEKETVFYGLVDDIRKSTDFSSGQPQRTIQITGRGFNKAFLNFEVGNVENITIDYSQGWMQNLLYLASCDSYDAIRLTLESYIGNVIKYSFGNGKTFEDYFRYSGSHLDGEILTDETGYMSYVGSLWNFIKELGNTPFNETFWEVVDDFPTLIHRPTPFNPEEWNALTVKTLEDEDIVSDNTGRSDLETYTLFSVESALLDSTSGALFLPLWYEPFYAKYGIRHLRVGTSYQFWKDVEGSQTTPDTQIQQFFLDIFNFNIKNNVFNNGQLVVKGKASYKVGERLLVSSDNIEYYIEGVTHSFNLFTSWTTTLNVTRGIAPEERFTLPWGAGEQLTPQIMSALIGQTYSEDTRWDETPSTVSPNYSSLPNSTGTPGNPGDPSSDENSYEYASGQYQWPTPGNSYITSPFGYRYNPISLNYEFHGAIDISAPFDAPIVSVASGVVIQSGPAQGYGNVIKIDHGSGLVSLYAHMKTLYVESGDIVYQGQKIALVGSEGMSTGPHLHLEILQDGERTNPEVFFSKKTNTVTEVLSKSETEQVCYNRLTEYGFNKAATCGILSNINSQSGFSSISTSNNSYGLLSWSGDGFTSLKSWCSENNLDFMSTAGQLDYLIYDLITSFPELRETLLQIENSQNGSGTAAYDFCYYYCAPVNKVQESSQRADMAKRIYWEKY